MVQVDYFPLELDICHRLVEASKILGFLNNRFNAVDLYIAPGSILKYL